MVHVYEGMGLHGDGGMGHYGDWVWDFMVIHTRVKAQKLNPL